MSYFKDEYQFTFGGNVASERDTGFLVPQSGRIKKIKVKISFRGKDFSIVASEGSFIFTIIAIKDTGEVSNLLTYECLIRDYRPIADDSIFRKCGFDRDPENIAISEGDVINIRTEKADNKCFLELFGLSVPDFSFLFTFLLELDPL